MVNAWRKGGYEVVGSEFNRSCYDEVVFCCLVFFDVTGTNHEAYKQSNAIRP